MGSKTNMLENIILDHVLGGPGYTRPATTWVALYTVAPGEEDGGTEVSSIDTGYARYELTNNVVNWPPAAAGLKSNGIDIEFPEATADWGLVVAFGLLDAASSGNLLYYGSLVENKQVQAGDTAKFLEGDLRIYED